MKPVLLACALALALGGCQTISPGQPIQPVITVPGQYQTWVDILKKSCNFLPDLASAAALFTEYGGNIQAAISAVCHVTDLFKSQQRATVTRAGFGTGTAKAGQRIVFRLGNADIQGRVIQ